MTPGSAAALSDDPEAGQPWVAEIAAPDAWSITTGDPSVVVAIVDTGVDVAHPDLAPNAWRNPAETANGADDDADGLVDDLAGWSFGHDSADVADRSGHGTHVAGLVAARGDAGVAPPGVCRSCRILPVDVYREGGRGTLADLARGMAYAAQRARVVNLSLESPVSSDAVAAAVAEHPDRLFVVSAGNGARDVDAAPTYPCAVPAENLICVAADDAGEPGAEANWGARTVHLAAPGVGLVSTAPGGGTATMSGSSFAAPLVSGAAALLWSWRPDATVAQVRSAILDGAEPLPAWAGRTATGSRLHAFGAMRALAAARGEAPPAPRPQADAPVRASAHSSAATAAPLPAVAPRGRSAGGSVSVRLLCRSRTRACAGTVRALGSARRVTVAPRGSRVLAFPGRRTLRRGGGRRLRVLVEAGERRRVYRVSVAR
jgi:subtilisin family serine protease